MKEKLQHAGQKKEEHFMGAPLTPIVILFHGTNRWLSHAQIAIMLILWKSGREMKVPRLFVPNANIKKLQSRNFLERGSERLSDYIGGWARRI